MHQWELKVLGAKIRNEDGDLTMAEKDCVSNSSEEEVEDLKNFVPEKL